VGMYYLAHWIGSVHWCFGALIAATDPVSVVATFREAKAQGRLLLLVEAESLFNDGTAAVAFAAALAMGIGHKPHSCRDDRNRSHDGGRRFVCAEPPWRGWCFCCRSHRGPSVEITFTTVAAYGLFPARGAFPLSGVLATLAAGLMLGISARSGHLHPRKGGGSGILGLRRFRFANSLVFLLIGMHVARGIRRCVGCPPWPQILLVVSAARSPSIPAVSVFVVRPARDLAAPAHFVLGRPARRPGARPGPGAAAGIARPGIHHHHQLCRGRILRLCAGPDDAPLCEDSEKFRRGRLCRPSDSGLGPALSSRARAPVEFFRLQSQIRYPELGLQTVQDHG